MPRRGLCHRLATPGACTGRNRSHRTRTGSVLGFLFGYWRKQTVMRTLKIAARLLAAAPLWAASYYTTRLEDPKAVTLTPANFPVKGDGVADDSDAIQQAINKVQETPGAGVVMVPEGRYRITKTVYVWPSIRVIGYGANRPVFVLGDNTPGYQDPQAEKYMVFFSGGRPGGGRGAGAPAGAPP